MLISINLPKPAAHFGAAYQRFIPRNEMDIAVVGVASAITLDATGQKVESARIALASVGPTPIFAKQASEFLAGQTATEETFAKAGAIASTEATPISDMRGTIKQRHHLVEVLTRRTLVQAVRRARGNA